MLYADKAALENRTKLRLLAIRERELTLYTQNCFTIGTVAALMAGLAYSSLVRRAAASGRARLFTLAADRPRTLAPPPAPPTQIYTKMEYFQEANPSVQSLYVFGNTVRPATRRPPPACPPRCTHGARACASSSSSCACTSPSVR